ncbi:hypothetical protein [Aquimarina pacifica]|nr:hypothetical protein [Aquimarina pacifica]
MKHKIEIREKNIENIYWMIILLIMGSYIAGFLLGNLALNFSL